MREIDDPTMWRAIWVALSPWRTLAHKQAPLVSHAFTVEERDPDRPIIGSPITNDGCRVVGVAGMVVDPDHFHRVVLPRAVDNSLLRFFHDRGGRDNVVVSTRDGRDRLVIGDEEDATQGDDVSRAMAFVSTDHRISVGSRYAIPEQWAQSNFLLNVPLSGLLGLVLLGGVVLALRSASRAMRLSQMKADFAFNVSHELRTPLASIRVFGEFLRLGRVRDEAKTREYGEYIETASRRLTQLIDDILDFAKIERGAKTYAFETLDLRDVLGEALRPLEVGLRHQGIELHVEDTGRPLPGLRLDTDAIARALTNLVDEQRKIFDRFHRVGTALVHDVKGSGLGLSIVSQVIAAHGGEIRVDSESGRGSTFTIVRPLHHEVGETAAARGRVSIAPAGEG